MNISLQTLGRYTVRVILAVFTVTAFAVVPLGAQSDSSIGQSFQTEDDGVVPGALVSLKEGSPNFVELASVENIDQMLGVVGSESLIELSSGGAASIQVVTAGKATIIVSDINGTVRTGDKVTASPIAGVGMRATASGVIIGTAQAGLESQETENRTVKDREGNEKVVRLGPILVQVDKVYYELPVDQNSFLPPAFQAFANSVAGKQVSAIRVMIAGFMIIFLFVTVATLLYSAVRSGIISIGRNPLSEKAVHKSFWQVGLTVMAVMVFTVGVIYLILTV